MWLNGSQLRTTLSGLRSKTSSIARVLLSRLPCVNITPLGLQVVPEVYMIVDRESRTSADSLRASSPPTDLNALRPRCRNARHENNGTWARSPISDRCALLSNPCSLILDP